MYTQKQFTIGDIKDKNQLCPGTISEGGYSYVVTQYSVDASAGLQPECFKQVDIAAFGSEDEAEAFCIKQYARTFDAGCAIQYFYRVSCIEVK